MCEHKKKSQPNSKSAQHNIINRRNTHLSIRNEMPKYLIDGTVEQHVKEQVVAAMLRHASLSGATVDILAAPSITTSRDFVLNVAMPGAQLIRIDNSSTLSIGFFYHFRYVWLEGKSTVEEAVDDVALFATKRAAFVSTRGSTEATVFDETSDVTPLKPSMGEARFLSVVRDGLANDGGLYLPIQLSGVAPSQLEFLATAPALSYQDVAQLVLEKLVDPSQLPPGVLQNFIAEAYQPSRWVNSEVCPLTPLHLGAATERVQLLELYHGPTAAFKDFALQLFPYMFGLSTNGLGKYMILAATSGDTGVAAIVGFLNSSPETRVMVLYPNHGVSPVQKVQMQSCDDGDHVRVFGVDSDFDFCQTTVKDIFQDEDVQAELLTKYGLTLSSANSINFGRLIPQVVYYFYAYRSLLSNGSLSAFGEPFDVCVPSGNFGNLLSCYIAKKMGLPVRKLILASNVNDVLFEFINTGVYDISKRSLTVTASPSIDILKASNVERFLYFLTNGNAAMVRQYMSDLNEKKRFELDPEVFAEVKASFWAMRCDESQCADTIHGVFEASQKKRVLDPHTAVGVFAAQAYVEQCPDANKLPLVVASTAHWAKFPEPVLRALQPQHAALNLVKDSGISAHSLVAALHEAVVSLGNGVTIHPALAAAMKKAETNSDSGRTLAKDVKCVLQELGTFAATQ